MNLISSNGFITIIDDEFKYLNKLTWRARVSKHQIYFHTIIFTGKRNNNICSKYPQGKKIYKEIPLTYFILGQPPKNNIIDHKDGNTLNNQKSNLRFATRSQNSQNRKVKSDSKTQLKGVVWEKYHKNNLAGAYKSYIFFQKKSIKLGYYKTPELAALMYDFWAKELFGEFAKTNFKVVSWG